jgi:hypothetical protein
MGQEYGVFRKMTSLDAIDGKVTGLMANEWEWASFGFVLL